LGQLDSDCARLSRLLSRPRTITACFLGHSGVGKSTLLNALAAGACQVVPAGGIGPLTAMATEVRYSEQEFFRATYHPRHRLLRLLFSLEQRLRRSAAKGAIDEILNGVPDEMDLDQETRDEVTAEIENSNVGEAGDPLEGYIKQARQIVTGDQFNSAPLTYLVDALRLACDASGGCTSEITDADL